MFPVHFLCFELDVNDMHLYMGTICGLVLEEGQRELMQVNWTRTGRGLGGKKEILKTDKEGNVYLLLLMWQISH